MNSRFANFPVGSPKTGRVFIFKEILWKKYSSKAYSSIERNTGTVEEFHIHKKIPSDNKKNYYA